MISGNKKVAILQSNYIPWKGYFDLIDRVDEFIFYDDVQYTARDWRNRNIIKTQHGSQWLTIPVEHKGHITSSLNISDIIISDKRWNIKHWNSIIRSYSKAKYFKYYKEIFEVLYLGKEKTFLIDVNYQFIKSINEILNIKTKISSSKDYIKGKEKNDKLIHMLLEAGATEYISGPSAKSYIDEEKFKEANIKLTWMNYSQYPEYEQLYPPFDHYVSIIDLIFNCGQNAAKYFTAQF